MNSYVPDHTLQHQKASPTQFSNKKMDNNNRNSTLTSSVMENNLEGSPAWRLRGHVSFFVSQPTKTLRLGQVSDRHSNRRSDCRGSGSYPVLVAVSCSRFRVFTCYWDRCLRIFRKGLPRVLIWAWITLIEQNLF